MGGLRRLRLYVTATLYLTNPRCPPSGVRLATFDAVKKVRSNGEEKLEQEATLLQVARMLPASVETPAVPYAAVTRSGK